MLALPGLEIFYTVPAETFSNPFAPLDQEPVDTRR